LSLGSSVTAPAVSLSQLINYKFHQSLLY
jgi:hypothetical protein